jgi:hypothetical protein
MSILLTATLCPHQSRCPLRRCAGRHGRIVGLETRESGVAETPAVFQACAKYGCDRFIWPTTHPDRRSRPFRSLHRLSQPMSHVHSLRSWPDKCLNIAIALIDLSEWRCHRCSDRIASMIRDKKPIENIACTPAFAWEAIIEQVRCLVVRG